MADSIFTRIIKGEIPCYKIAETQNCFAFLDIRPLTLGHTLVIPKQQTDYLFDLEEPLFVELQLFAKKVAAAIKQSVPCARVGVTVIGLEVPHAHIHLIPFSSMEEMNFGNPKLNPAAEVMQELAAKISAAYNQQK